MLDAKKLLDQFLGTEIPGVSGTVRERAEQAAQLAKDNPLATGAIAAVLLGTGTGRQLTGSVAKLGGLAAIAGLGYLAYKNYTSGQSAEAAGQTQTAAQQLDLPPADSPFSPHSERLSNDFALALVRAMIAAAKADGRIDDAERRAITEKLAALDLGQEAQDFIAEELRNPTDLDALVAAAKSEEQKVELYTATRLVIEPDSRAERGWLDLLAGRLGLNDALVDHIDATVSAAKRSV